MAIREMGQGASGGATIGSMIAPGIGTAIGAGVGGLVGLMQEDPAVAQRKAMAEFLKQQQLALEGYTGEVKSAQQPYTVMGQGAPERQQAYLGALGELDPQRFKLGTPTLDRTGALEGVNNYLDPSMDFAIKQGTNQIEASAVGRGGLMSGATGNQIQSNAMNEGMKYWGDAYDRNLAELNRGNEITKDQFGLDLGSANRNLGLAERGLGYKKEAYNDVLSNLDTSTQMDLDLANTVLGYDQSNNNLKLQAGMVPKSNPWMDLLGAGANFTKTYKGL